MVQRDQDAAFFGTDLEETFARRSLKTLITHRQNIVAGGS
jgi:hypothetical protein